MVLTIRLLFPVLAQKINNLQFSGYIFIDKYTIAVYITNYTRLNKNISGSNKENVIKGHCLCCQTEKDKVKKKPYNYIVLDQHSNLYINCLTINGHQIKNLSNCIILLYNYDEMKNAETINDSGYYFSKLQMLIQNESKSETIYSPILKKPYGLSSSMICQHTLNYISLIYWLFNSARCDKKVRIRQGNLILAIIMDLVLGYIVLEILTQDTKELSSMLMEVLEKLVNSLYSLLKWLMGAPAGLKLNNAFNKMLGQYFSYHIQLWWLFLDVSGEKLDTILHICHYLGYYGLTFQAAIVSDMICIATFHSYCIYVYAARLFNIQISGLIALLRLFVGRKFNPLRGGIDSCEYTNQELFVGTVAFTILLLLLPTTAMYYIVFTLFRLLSLLVQYVLAKLIYHLQTIPLYVVTLWTIKSPKVAGNILIEVVNNKKCSPLLLKVNLFTKPVLELVKKFTPPVEVPKQVEWTNLLSNILMGKQIV